MKILVIADEESEALWDYFDKSKLNDIELIISCGDLKAEYLTFLATMTSAKVLYIHGNHDEDYMRKPPEGCTCIDDSIFVYKGIRIFGLGGSMKYNKGKFQFTEKEMKCRIIRCAFKLFMHKGFDILITHSPALGINDMDDLPHKGFECFRGLIEKYKPRFFIHGHVHMNYGRQIKRSITVGQTTIINAYEKYVIEY